MTNHCPDANADPGRRDSWGVDLNRNYRVGSGFDGYDGASTSCTSDTYQGPAELSEPESQEHHLAGREVPEHQVHDVGALQRRPAVLAAGRLHRGRPDHHAAPAAGRRGVLLAVGRPDPVAGRGLRETVVTPENVGGSSDVLYSSAGNVREDLYNNYGIYAFGWEVGGSVYNPATGNWQGGSFQPRVGGRPGPGQRPLRDDGVRQRHHGDVPDRRGLGQGQEGRDVQARARRRQSTRPSTCASRPTSRPPSTTRPTAAGPTLESPRYKATEFREPGEEL